MEEEEHATVFHINTEYANKYNRWREKEELQRLKDKYGDIGSEGSSSSEEEDDDAEEITVQVEKSWLQALAAIKRKDPKIYDKNVDFFKKDSKEAAKSNTNKSKEAKALYPKDMERKVMLEKSGIWSDEESSDEDLEKKSKLGPGYYQEQEDIKKSIKETVGDSDDDEEDLLTQRQKTAEEEQNEEEEYLTWLKGEKDNLTTSKDMGIELGSLREYWTAPTLDTNEKFLRDYILNKQYLDKDQHRLPTYDEIVEENISEEEKELEQQEVFERKYNFRYEEPDPEFIKSYPRTIGESVRRKDSKRTEKRKEVQDRKQKEKELKMEDLKRLKNLKKKEILEKIDKLKKVAGDEELEFSEKDVEGDFDPEEYDKRMKEVFDKDYYYVETEMETTKPVFSDDEDLELEDVNWDDWVGTSSQHQAGKSTAEKEESSCSESSSDEDVLEPSTSRGSNRRRKSKLAQALEKKKPVFDPEKYKSFDKYFEEYYKLDYEDIIGDTPCRFKYRSVPENDFGLDTSEVLNCKDRELNAWASLKKMTQYRSHDEEDHDKKMYLKKTRNIDKKTRLLPSLFEQSKDTEDTESEPNKKKRKRKRKTQTAPSTSSSEVRSRGKHKSKQEENVTTDVQPHKKLKLSPKVNSKQEETISPKNTQTTTEDPVASNKSKNKKKKSHHFQINLSAGGKGFQVSDERLKAYGINPRDFKYLNLNKHKTPSS